MSVNKAKTGLVVIGAGPGGYAAAFRAADLGMKVTLIDMEKNPGGVCLYRGCIPSKALLHVARVLSDAKEATAWGIDFGRPKIHPEKIKKWVEAIIEKLTGGLGQLAKSRKVEYMQGMASFLDSHTLQVDCQEGQLHLSFEHAIMATGSRPIHLFTEKFLQNPHLLSSTGALALEEIPKNLLVIGGGYIGLELGTVYATLGSKVTVVEMTKGLLPGVDADLVLPVSRRLKLLFESILLSTKVEKITEVQDGLKVFLHSAEGVEEKVFDKVLVAVGRRPNTSGLGLETTGVQCDDKGFVKVGPDRRTAEASIFAIGDITGNPMLAHKASHEAMVAVDTIAGKKAAFAPLAIPAVVFTDPEIAWCGLTEEAARAGGIAHEVVRFPWAASGRALTLGRVEGLTKLILDPQTEQILGVGLVGVGAGELIAEGVLALEMGATASDLKLTIHPHPTLSETMMEAAEVFFGQSVHLYRPKRKG